MLHFRRDCELLAATFQGQLAFLAGRSLQQRPSLSQGELGDGRAVDGDEAVAGIDACDRWVAVDIGYAGNGKSVVAFGVKNEADDVEIGKPEGASDVEIDRRVGVIEGDAVIH